jgi:hypothetical protein
LAQLRELWAPNDVDATVDHVEATISQAMANPLCTRAQFEQLPSGQDAVLLSRELPHATGW